jgi:hypothetical protein
MKRIVLLLTASRPRGQGQHTVEAMKPLHHPGLLAAFLLLPLHAGLAALTPITTVETKVISVTGFPGSDPSHTTVSDYGHKPSVILTANGHSPQV